MLSLLKKDFDTLIKQYKMFVILLVFFLLSGSVGTTDEFFSIFPLVICSWLTSCIIAYDERCIANGTADASPVPKKIYVVEKYLFVFISVVLSLIITVTGLTNRYTVGAPDFCNVLLTMLVSAFLVPGIMLPIIFREGAAKATLKYYAVLIIAVGLCYYFSAAFEYRYIAQIGLPLCIIVGAALLLLFFASCLLSIRLYEKRES